MTYLDIIQDREIMAIYSRIDILKQDEPKHYGIIHVLSTIEYARQLAECFELNIKERNLLFIACALHNIGHLNGKTLHAQTGAEMAKGYLRRNNIPSADITVIGSAIASHTGRRGDNFYDNVSACLILADKMDFGATRIKPYFEPLGAEDSICKQITSVSVARKEDTIELWLGGEDVDWQSFIESSIYSKMYRCFEIVCKKHSLKFVAKIKRIK